MSASVVAAMFIVGAGVVTGPASPALALSCVAQAKGGVNSNSSNWVTANAHACANSVQARAVRFHGATPPTYHVGSWGKTSTVTTPTTGTPGGGGVYSNANAPTKYKVFNFTDGVWHDLTFSW